RDKARRRVAENRVPSLLERAWQQISASFGTDAALASDLASSLQEAPSNSALYNLQRILCQAKTPGQLELAAHAFQSAWTSDPRHLTAGLNLAEVLVLMGQTNHAIEQARRTLALLDRLEQLPAAAMHRTCL